MTTQKLPNRLAGEKLSYLLQNVKNGELVALIQISF